MVGNGLLRLVDNRYCFEIHGGVKNINCIKQGNQFYRTNEIWREKIAKFKAGALLEEELIPKNYGKVMCESSGFKNNDSNEVFTL